MESDLNKSGISWACDPLYQSFVCLSCCRLVVQVTHCKSMSCEHFSERLISLNHKRVTVCALGSYVWRRQTLFCGPLNPGMDLWLVAVEMYQTCSFFSAALHFICSLLLRNTSWDHIPKFYDISGPLWLGSSSFLWETPFKEGTGSLREWASFHLFKFKALIQKHVMVVEYCSALITLTCFA